MGQTINRLKFCSGANQSQGLCMFPCFAVLNILAKCTLRQLEGEYLRGLFPNQRNSQYLPTSHDRKVPVRNNLPSLFRFETRFSGVAMGQGDWKGDGESFCIQCKELSVSPHAPRRLCHFHAFPLPNIIWFSHFKAKASCAASVEIRQPGNSGWQVVDFVCSCHLQRKTQPCNQPCLPTLYKDSEPWSSGKGRSLEFFMTFSLQGIPSDVLGH